MSREHPPKAPRSRVRCIRPTGCTGHTNNCRPRCPTLRPLALETRLLELQSFLQGLAGTIVPRLNLGFHVGVGFAKAVPSAHGESRMTRFSGSPARGFGFERRTTMAAPARVPGSPSPGPRWRSRTVPYVATRHARLNGLGSDRGPNLPWVLSRAGPRGADPCVWCRELRPHGFLHPDRQCMVADRRHGGPARSPRALVVAHGAGRHPGALTDFEDQQDFHAFNGEPSTRLEGHTEVAAPVVWRILRIRPVGVCVRCG